MYCHPADWGLGHPSATEQPAGRRSCEFGRLLKYGKWCSKLLFFEAITLCHVRERCPSGQKRLMVQGLGELLDCFFLLIEVVKIDF